MGTILRSNDPVLISFARALLKDAGITVWDADSIPSATELGLYFFPIRLVVSDGEAEKARQVLKEAGLGENLVD